MEAIIEDWVNFCTGKKSFEEGHFYSLFHGINSRQELEKIFQFFDQKLDLIERTKRYLELRSSQNMKRADENLLKKFLHEDLKEKETILKINSSLREKYSQLQIIYVEDHKKIEELRFDDQTSQEFFDFIDFELVHEDERIDILYDSFYGLTADFDYRLFLFLPFIRIEYDMTSLIEFKKKGGVYAIQENNLLFSMQINDSSTAQPV